MPVRRQVFECDVVVLGGIVNPAADLAYILLVHVCLSFCCIAFYVRSFRPTRSNPPCCRLFLRLPIAALRTHAVLQRDAAPRTPIHRHAGRKLGRRRIVATRERDLHDVELVLQELVHHLDESLDGHGLLRDHEPTLRICGAEVRLEGWTLHRVRRCAVANPLFLIHVENRGKERIILAQDERVVEVPEDIPGGLLDLVAREDHIDPRIDRVLDLQRQPAGMTVQILRLALETVEPVGVLEIEMRDRANRLTAALGVLVHVFLFLLGCLLRPVVPTHTVKSAFRFDSAYYGLFLCRCKLSKQRKLKISIFK